jgi:hypothetical protein
MSDHLNELLVTFLQENGNQKLGKISEGFLALHQQEGQPTKGSVEAEIRRLAIKFNKGWKLKSLMEEASVDVLGHIDGKEPEVIMEIDKENTPSQSNLPSKPISVVIDGFVSNPFL